jgi:hypothetical protein
MTEQKEALKDLRLSLTNLQIFIDGVKEHRDLLVSGRKNACPKMRHMLQKVKKECQALRVESMTFLQSMPKRAAPEVMIMEQGENIVVIVDNEIVETVPKVNMIHQSLTEQKNVEQLQIQSTVFEPKVKKPRAPRVKKESPSKEKL